MHPVVTTGASLSAIPTPSTVEICTTRWWRQLPGLTGAKATPPCGSISAVWDKAGAALTREGVSRRTFGRLPHGWPSKGMRSVDLAGYSFGAWVNALTGGDFSPVGRMIMVSPPVAFIDFSSVGRLEALHLVVTGEDDDIAPVEEVRTAVQVWNPEARFEPVEGADHFYSGCLDLLEAILEGCL